MKVMVNLFFIGLSSFLLTMCGQSQVEKKTPNAEVTLTQKNEAYITEMNTPGLVRIKTDLLQLQDEVLKLTKSGNVIDSIFSEDNNEPTFSSRLVKIWSYFPEYYIVILEAYPLDNDGFYKVIMSGDTLLLPHRENVTIFETWQEHIITSFVLTTKDNPLKAQPDINAESLMFDYEELSFEVIEVKEEWVYVKCNRDCEGCPDKEVRGWIKWKEKNSLRVELRYTC